MEDKLVDLSKEKGFASRDNLVTVNSCYINLWMCEVQQWLREVHDIVVEPSLNFTPDRDEDFGWNISIMTNTDSLQGLKWVATDITGKCFKSYEGALEAGLFEALNLI